MLEFFSGCASLFSRTFNAACGLEFFKFLAALIALEILVGLYLTFYHGAKKL